MRGLRAVEPWLADEALLVVDDHDWDDVARATRDYLAAEQRAELLFDIAGGDAASRSGGTVSRCSAGGRPG